MKVAVLGGSFNPVHEGHVALAKSVCEELGYDRLLFVPSFYPPHKIISGAPSDEDRVKMLSLACLSDSRFEVECCELDRKGISYTWDTVCFLEQKYSGNLSAKIGLVLGQDLAAEYYKWKNAEQLAQKTDIILARRPEEILSPTADSSKAGFLNAGEENRSGKAETAVNVPRGPYTGIIASDQMLEDFPYPHKILKNPLLPVSSTQIRQKISSGRDWRDLVPFEVYCYIRKRKLYGYKA
ncbi:nicotinate (nicotinamide) nucleotide adenylyltransferase [Treponema parvum]|uniref:Probable nicotinate-nucleotide adenylyltransferase n=1 Tax=Treponema parvum TaxID=138851 RepID=A0A975IC73_9SPIR|nr:nicotinate (nicotinamide) nucleotide adenylyltransferase [Treponema parvum]QTQ11488.1 nicotinate (nicotinamide) nucleotide adenylyltransferase [Treponema parvum]